jgi:hypothetical protein
MDDHSCRLINDDDRWIFIEDGEWKGLRFQREGLGLRKGS